MAKRPFKKRSPRRGVLPSLTPRDDFRSEYLSRRVNALSAPRKVEGIRRSLEKFRLYGALRETSTRTCDHVPTREELKAEKAGDDEEEEQIAKPPQDSDVPKLPELSKNLTLMMSLKVRAVLMAKKRNRAKVAEVAASYDVEMKGKDISYKYFFLPRLTSKYVPERGTSPV
ncbi:hypothetical protein NP493_890g02018 [Ridgeia piscesae]|uniref:Uncharacterized protein n=1 Tax=Ridgeia piscesae TaxID=27915 RepID=A0AAD9NN53_RIDPI|nr:hypothetical protein NP493_890g02018 [Ridgeia piscesae]